VTATRSVLFVHQNFPGQFPRIARALMARGDRVAAIGGETAREMPGVDLRRWTTNRGTTPGILPLAVRAEADLIRANAAARTAVALAAEGFRPDVIVGHPGWGETLHLKEVWPDAKLILLAEFWYAVRGGDVGFDPEFTAPDAGLNEAAALNARNMGHALAYALADTIVSPTPFQAGTFPPAIRQRIHVHHEGINLAQARRHIGVKLRLPSGKVLDGSGPVVTFIARTLEPLRGFHSFMRALPRVMAERPDAEVVVIGTADRAGYGLPPPTGRTWRDVLLEEVGDRLDRSRLHFTGHVSHREMIDVLSLSAAHVYLTYPFTLSWSLIEAMACGCGIVASDTAPVRDVIRHGENGLLVDFFAQEAIASAVIELVAAPEKRERLGGEAVRFAADWFDAEKVGTPGWLHLIDRISDAARS